MSAEKSMDELTRAEARCRRLAMDKSYLQLVTRLMTKIGSSPGLENTIDATLKNICDVIGGVNIVLYYYWEDGLHYADVFGERRRVDDVSDPVVAEALRTRQAREYTHAHTDTLMLMKVSEEAYTWVFPLMVEDDLVGVLKLESLSMALQPLYRHLPPLMSYLALTLRNEIWGYAKLAQVNRELREQIREREAAESALRDLAQELEERVLHRTEQLLRTTSMLEEELQQRTAAQRKLAASEARYADLYERAPAMYLSVDVRRGCLVGCNQTALDALGYSREELIGRPLLELYAPGSRDAAKRAFQQLVATGSVHEVELKVLRKDGSHMDVSLTSAALRDDDGEVIQARSIWRDITQSKAAESAVRQSEARFRAVFEAAPVGLAVWSPESEKLVSVNTAFLRIFGQVDALVGAGWRPVDPSVGAREAVERSYVRADGSEVWFTERVASLNGSDGEQGARQWLLVFEDVTSARKLEQDRSRMIAAMEHAGESIVIADAAGDIVYVNPAFEEVTGYLKGEVVGKNPRILKSGVQDAAFYRAMWDTLTSGAVWSGRLVNRTRSGELITEETTISPIFSGSTGRIVSYVAVKRNITAKLELEAQLRQNQKLEAIGTLAGGIAHDFNNILTAILGYSEIVRLMIPEDSEAAECQREVLRAGHRAQDLVRQILTFSRVSPESRASVAVDEVLREALTLLRASIPSTIAFDIRIEPTCSRVFADATQLHQVFMNLVTNAYHAMRERGGALAVSAGDVILGESEVASLPDLTPGEYLRVEVRDTGTGMSADVLERIFEPYFTTKPTGEGTGLGLSVVHSIVRSCGGHCVVTSELGVGTSVVLLFPPHDADILEEEAPVPNELPRGDEHVVVVDDEPSITTLLATILRDQGYRVTRFSDPRRALTYCEEHGDDVALVLTDLTMPHMTGLELAEALLALRPRRPVVLCSGLCTQEAEERARRVGVSDILHKPIARSRLLTLVRTLLDRSPREPEAM